ncbi:MAG: TIGR04255 family protein [Rhodospirillales bacterium]
MTETVNLPKFDRPPVIEVVHGVRFRRLNFDITHPAHFHDLIKDRYPRVQMVPALPPEPEFFGMPQLPTLRFGIPLQVELPRAWFISEDDTRLIQLQSDRLLFNWRAGSGSGIYPRFEIISAEFQKILDIFVDFAATTGIGPVEAELCEMVYINQMGRWSHGSKMRPDDWLRGWSSDIGSDWGEPMEDFSSVARFALKHPDGQAYGRITVSASTIVVPPSLDRALQLEIMVRGTPTSADSSGIEGFHQIAHDRIVRCFSAMTTDNAHREWGKVNG